MNRLAVIKSTGAYLPEQIITNDDLAKKIDTSDEWITSRTGIKQRHQAAAGENCSDLATRAAAQALANAGMAIDEIDLILVATTTPDRSMPSTACLVQKNLGMSHGMAFDLQAVCSGFVYGLSVADAMIANGTVQSVLLIGAETMTRLLNWEDRNTCVLFGDGAGAVILKAEIGEDKATQSGLLAHYLRSDGNFSELLQTDGGVSLTGEAGHITMNGREVFRHAVTNISEAILAVLSQTGLTIADIDWFVPHQANKRILASVANRLGLDENKILVTVDRHANTSAASIPLALHEAVTNGRVQKGQLVLFEAMGSGLTWGASLARW